jgi:hypothetical protein
MYTKANAAQLMVSYSIIASSFVSNTSEDVFDFDDFKNIEKLPWDLVDKLIPYCDDFIGIIKGYVNESEILGFIRTMSFPKRFLKLETVDELPENQKEEVERKLEQAFFLGLIFHFLVWDVPTRKKFNEVNFDNLIKGWVNRTLLADKHCKSSNKQANKLTQSFFSYYYDRSLEPFFKDDLKFRYLKRGECFAYFHNLFYAGVLLGIHLDVATLER